MAKKELKPSFFEKNIKYILIVVFILFIFKTTQSCSRNMRITTLDKNIEYLQDSLTTFHGSEKTLLLEQLEVAEDSIKELNYELRLAAERVLAADKRANAVQSTAEKIRDNTTINIENKNSKEDTITVNKNKK